MPVNPTYPGVYVEEIPSGVRTIVGVATSITAFIGKTNNGPANVATTITSFADFERLFGGLSVNSSLSYAVRDFYQNGGSQAIIVRLTGKNSKAAKITVDDLTLQAVSGGAWGTFLRARIDHNTRNAPGKNTPDPTLFNLYIRNTATGQTETFLNVAMDTTNPRRVDKVLQNESQLVQISGTLPTPAANIPAASANPAKPNQDPWGDNTPATNYPSDGVGVDGADLTYADDFSPANAQSQKIGLYALEQVDLFNLLCIPPYQTTTDGYDIEDSLLTDAAAYCAARRAMLLLDSPSKWNSVANAVGTVGDITKGIAEIVAAASPNGKNAAVFFPRVLKADSLLGNQTGTFAPSGAIAGIFARTDAQRGVWKAPAGLDAGIAGILGLTVPLTDLENGELNPLGVNCLRIFSGAGTVVWGSRTLDGNDNLASEYKYIPVRRTALYIEESLYRGLKWVVFEPNDEPLWAQIRLNVGAFMQNLFRKGAFQGKTPRDAYFVKCDSETTTQNDIDLGIVNILVGFAPLKPAEFVILQLQQMAGQIQV
jgi:uncharacterized protein